MKQQARRSVLCGVLALGLLIPAAHAQKQVAPETYVHLNADASAGYVKSSAQNGLSSFNFGLSADLAGYFYHPNFLTFQFAPYYNQGREYSTADFISGDKGFSTSANLFGGSRIPLFINYSKGVTHSGLFGVVGSESSVVGEGSNDNFAVNWSARFDKIPTIQAGYFRSGGDYRIFGSSGGRGNSHSSGYLLASQYNVLGFAMGARYTNQKLAQVVPNVFLTDQRSASSTIQRNLEFTLNRQVGKNTFFDAVAGRSHYDTDATTLPQNRRFDTMRTGVTSRPLAHLAVSFRVNYVSDLNALLIGSVLPGSSGGTGPLLLTSLESRTKYLTYSGTATYVISRELNVRAAYRHGTSKFTGRSNNEDSAWNSSVEYRRNAFGGRLTTSYSLGLYRFENGGAESNSRGHSGTLTFSKVVRGWQHFGTFQYSTSSIESLLPGQLKMLSTEIGTSGVIRGWRTISTFRYEKADSIFNAQTENSRRMFRVSVSKKTIQLTGSMQSGKGLSIISISGIQPVSGTPVVVVGSEFNRLLIPNESLSFSFSASYQMGKRTTFNGNWSKMHYSTVQGGIERKNQLDQLNFYVRHWFRRLDCRAGFQRYHQQFSGFGGLYNANTVYFQVSRHFNVF